MNTLQFAEYELRRYAAKMNICTEIIFEVTPERFNKKVFLKFDSELDDAFEISVKNGKGVIYATNNRSVLFGVYRFLMLQGCRFIRPGEKGEYVPIVDCIKDVQETVYANIRHRGAEDMCCYGGIETMLAIVDWLPKVMMNTYFTEFTDSFWMMKFSYGMGDNPYKQTMNVTRELFELWMQKLNEEIKKRGIIRHSGGHGWTVMLMDGINDIKTKLQIQELNEHPVCENTEILPLTKGKRTIWDNTPLNTHFCLSNKAARKRFTDCVCEYSEKHTEVDYLHIWLGDSYSNFCECEKCSVMTPTDWYVKLLNEIDAELTKRNLKQKLVFLAYFELLYPPVTERIKNEDRFTLLFCPIGRDFTVPYKNIKPLDYKPALKNTFSQMNMRGEFYLRQLEQWKEIFHGDVILFDYIMYDRSFFLDFSNLNATSVMVDDSIYIKELGINGRIECGSPTSTFPTSFCFYSMANTLFYGNELLVKDFFDDVFGSDTAVSDFLLSLRDVIPEEIIKKKRKSLNKNEFAKLKNIYDNINDIISEASFYCPSDAFLNYNRKVALEYLYVIKMIFGIIINKIDGVFSSEQFEKEALKLRDLLYYLEKTLPFTVTAKSLYEHLYHNLLNYLQP